MSRIPPGLQQKIRNAAQNRCGYCLSSQKYVLGWLEIEHIIPVAKNGSDNEDNLWLACRLCNKHKDDKVKGRDPLSGQTVPLFNPRKQKWKRHFQWNADSTQIIGKTKVGRATVLALKLNNPIAVEVRRNWVSAGWHPPKD